jgi:membrane protein
MVDIINVLSSINKMYSVIFVAIIYMLSIFAFVTYMVENSFFSYEIFKIGNMPIFALAFLCGFSMCIVLHMIAILSFYSFLQGDCRFGALFAISAFVVVLIFICWVYKNTETPGRIIIIYSVSLILSLLLAYAFYNRSNEEAKKVIIAILIVMFGVYLCSLLIMPKVYADLYSLFLKSLSLAADNVKIYLKDENKYVHGKLIFDDGKYAYVRFNHTYGNCSIDSNTCEVVRKKVSSEDVSIIVWPK